MSVKHLLFIGVTSLLLASCGWNKVKEEINTVVIDKPSIWADVEKKPVLAWPTGYSMYKWEDLSSIWEKSVIFFHQASCGTCVKTAKDIMSQTSLPSGVKIIQADIDTDTALASKYGVTSKHTFVYIDEKGEKISQTGGLMNVADIQKFVDESKNGWSKVESNSETVSTGGPAWYSMYKWEDLSSIWEKTVVFFHQKSCGTCVKTAKDIVSQTSLPSGVKIIQADIDTDTALASKYGVITKHTFVYIDEKGEKISQTGGLMNVAEIADFVQKSTTDSTASTVSNLAGYSMYKWEDLTNVGENAVVFFHQASCGTCVKTAWNLTAQEWNMPAGVKVIQANIDTDTDLAAKYGVTSKHTFVYIDAAWKKIASTGGLITVADIEGFVKENS